MSDPQNVENDVERIYWRDLRALSQNGAPCEACGRHMNAHAWADLDIFGAVVACAFEPTGSAGGEA